MRREIQYLEAINGLKVNTPQGNKKVLVVRVEDKDGNPVDGCAFVIKDSAFPNALDGMAKYPSNGVVKFTLTDSSQLGGIIRVHSWSSADYEGNELTFTSKNKEFLALAVLITAGNLALTTQAADA